MLGCAGAGAGGARGACGSAGRASVRGARACGARGRAGRAGVRGARACGARGSDRSARGAGLARRVQARGLCAPGHAGWAVGYALGALSLF